MTFNSVLHLYKGNAHLRLIIKTECPAQMERSLSHGSTAHLVIFVLWNLLFLSLGCKEVERQALLSFRQSLSDPANRLSSWSSADCCKWSGISCHNKTGRVIKLDLRNRHRLVFNSQEVNSSLRHLKYLQYMDLSGNDFQRIPIPNFFGNFHELRYLNLSNAWFGGNVPHHLGNLSNLGSLDLSIRFIAVDGLSWVSGLSSLEFLDMSGVALDSISNPLRAINLLPRLVELRLASCRIRSYSYLSNLTALAVLDLSYNPINSPFPSHLGNFTSLEVLSLRFTGFWGPLPNYLGSMIKLEEIDLSGNTLGTIKKNVFSNMCNLNLKSLSLVYSHVIGRFPNLFHNSSCLQTNRLEILDLSSNEFTGTIPPYLGNFTSLRILDLQRNHFQGVISEVHFEKLSNLKYLSLGFNSLSLKMRSGWHPPFTLEKLFLSCSNVGPEFPLWLTTQNKLSTLDLSNTSLRGELPQSFLNFSLSGPSFELEIDLSFNQLHGNIPNILKPNDQRLRLFLNNNNFEGSLPRVPPNTTWIDLSHNFLSGSINESKFQGLFALLLAHNSFSGTIPYSFCKYKWLHILDLSYNRFTGGFPNCLYGLPYLIGLDISSNDLGGVVPDSIGKMYSLEYLHLGNNKFNGQIPSSIKNCTKLKILDLGKNKFSGSIPLWIGEHLQMLRVLSLHSNELNGSIPPQLCLLRGLKFLDLSQNNLSGSIPQCFPNFTHMVIVQRALLGPPTDNYVHIPFRESYGERISVVNKGKEVEYFDNLKYVTLLDLSSNNLVGEIPESISKLHGLEFLNLSRNRLEGNIPGKIGDIQNLESLDLSQNKISGKIPPSMSSLYFLSHLNLSQNNLSGEIPSGYQLQTLDDPSIYMGNPQLCGAPLKKHCRLDEPSEDHRKVEILNKKGSEINWFYIGMASGHVVGFGGFCAILFLNRKWRYAYYRVLSSMADWLVVTALVNISQMKRKLKVNQIQE